MTRLPVVAAVAAALAAAAPAGSATAEAQASVERLPQASKELADYVSHALEAHDLDAFDRLVEWEGARPVRRRMTLYQIRYNFGRPIKSAVVEPIPPDGLGDAHALLSLKPNLPVTERLRVTFDEPPGPSGEQPACVFLLGKEDGVYRISLLLGAPPR